LIDVIDLCSRRMVGWSMRAAMSSDLVTNVLIMAVWRLSHPREFMHQAGRGSQHTSEQCQRLIARHGIVCSLSRAGNVWDNAVMEGCFLTLQTARKARNTYRTRDAARADAFEYVEGFLSREDGIRRPGI